MEIEKVIVKRIKEARKETGIKQYQIAEMLHKTPAAISDIERERVNVSAGDLFKIAQVLNKPIEYFYGEDLGAKEAEKAIALMRRLDKKDRDQLLTYLTSNEEMLRVADKLEVTDKDDDDTLRVLLLEYYQKLIPFIKALDTIRANMINSKDKIEKALGLTNE